MICKDCEMEVEKVSKKTGRCHKCTIRKNNCDYKKIEYVPLKDLKGTPEYNRVMGRRYHGTKTAEIVVDKINEKEIKSDVEQIEDTQRKIANETVDKDIQDAIERLKIDKSTLNLPFMFVLDSFCNIFDKSIIRAKEVMQKEYDTLIADRLHVLIHTDEYAEICKVGLEQKYIQEKRVIVKNEMKLYEPFRTFVDSLLNDEIYKEQIKIAIEDYKRIKEELNDPKYITDTLSMQDKDFVMSFNKNTMRTIVERKKQKRYYCAVGCYNLYGNKDKALLEANGGMIATDEKEAKEKFKQFIKTYFDTVVYSEKDIIIKEMALQ